MHRKAQRPRPPRAGIFAALLCLSLAAQSTNAVSATVGWHQALRAELAKCEKLSFFKRQACSEKARWKYCSKPGHSDLADECQSGAAQNGHKHATPNWVYPLRAELAECEKLGYFKSQACIEKARWKHCRDRWEQAEECGKKKWQSPDGGAPGL